MSNIEKVKQGARDILIGKLPDLSIQSIIKYLQERSEVSLAGRMGKDSIVNKEALRLAAVYLQEYLDVLNNDI